MQPEGLGPKHQERGKGSQLVRCFAARQRCPGAAPCWGTGPGETLGSRPGGASSTAAPCRALGDTMGTDCPQPDASIIAVLWLPEGSPRAGLGCLGLRGAFPLRTCSLWLAQKPVPLSEPNSLRILPFPLQALLAATLPGGYRAPWPSAGARQRLCWLSDVSRPGVLERCVQCGG